MIHDEYPHPEISKVRLFPDFNRRDFLKITGGGIIVFFTLKDVSGFDLQQRGGMYPSDFNVYLRIGSDDKVECFTGKIEMGQGPVTALAQVAADELDVPIDAVDMILGDTDRCPYDMGTFGSMTIRYFAPALRAAAAEARAVLIELASERLDVPKDRLTAENAVVFERAQPSNRVKYSELTLGRVIERRLEGTVEQKSLDELKIIGQPYKRTDSREKVNGTAQFAGDIQFPGMLYGKILRPPAHGAALRSVDISEAEKMDGVQVVREDDFIAVLHELPDAAQAALEAIRADFDVPDTGPDNNTLFDHLINTAPEANISESGGNLATGDSISEVKFDESYYNHYVAHAPIETHTATARIEDGRVTVWASTQAPFRVKDEVARGIGVEPDNVRIITPFVGGGFGGKTAAQQAVEAARLAKATGKPVQVFWSRKEEFFFDTFRPAAVVKIKSGISNAGKILYWDYDVIAAGQRGSDNFYDIPHFQISVKGEWGRGAPGVHPFGVGPWRAPACNTNTFARESQIDIMAAQAGIDPVEFRLMNLKDERMIRVLKAAADKFGWTPITMPSGKGLGVSLGIDAGTYVAHMAEVEVDKTRGTIQVKRVVCAQDMGLSVNPQGSTIQMEGCITMGLGYALSEEIRFKGGEIFDTNFDTYEITRFSWLPEIETVIVDNKELASQGGGEPPIIGMGAVVANAVYDATGARVYYLPMTPERVRSALQG
ncbi:molybdopterin cofactor-binding domain-containing protein [candidate division KSB1 bacterium]